VVTTEAASDFVVAGDGTGTRWGLAAVCACFTAVGVALIIFGGLGGLVVGAAAVAFFGALGLPIFLFWVIHPIPRLAVNSTGITINRYAISDCGMVGWDDVTTVGVASKGSSSFVSVTVRDPAEFLRCQPRPRRALLRLNGWGRLPVVRITSAPLPVSTSDLAAAISAGRGRPPDDEFRLPD
jgi:hypothetical protein